MSLSVTYASQITVIETVEGVFVGSDAEYGVSGLNTTATLTASTTPPVTKYSAYELTLSSGTGSIDLTSLPNYNGVAASVTFDGLKPQVVKFKNKSTNANAITIVKGVTTGYTGFGSAFSMTLQPGDEWAFKGNDNSGVTDVSSTVKILDVSGTGSQVLQIELVAG